MPGQWPIAACTLAHPFRRLYWTGLTVADQTLHCFHHRIMDEAPRNGIGRHRILALECLMELPPIARRFASTFGCRQAQLPIPHGLPGKRSKQFAKPVIVGSQQEQLAEPLANLHIFIQGARLRDKTLRLGDARLELIEEIALDVLARLSSDYAVQHLADLEDLPHLFHRERRNMRPTIGHDPDDAVLLENSQRLSDRPPAYTEALRKLLLLNAIARLQFTGENALTDLFGDLLRQRRRTAHGPEPAGPLAHWLHFFDGRVVGLSRSP